MSLAHGHGGGQLRPEGAAGRAGPRPSHGRQLPSRGRTPPVGDASAACSSRAMRCPRSPSATGRAVSNRACPQDESENRDEDLALFPPCFVSRSAQSLQRREPGWAASCNVRHRCSLPVDMYATANTRSTRRRAGATPPRPSLIRPRHRCEFGARPGPPPLGRTRGPQPAAAGPRKAVRIRARRRRRRRGAAAPPRRGEGPPPPQCLPARRRPGECVRERSD